MTPGHFITFEGVDGCGKTTQLNLAAEFLRERDVPFITTREPGGTRVAEMIRELILCPDHEEIVDSCELLLYLAARAQHVQEKIRPALERGMSVLCDRFAEATFAYQGYGRGFELENLVRLNDFATGGLTPSLTFIFDIPVELAMDRMRGMGKAHDRLERNGREFHERVREGYRAQAAAQTDRMVLFDGRRSIDELASEVRARLSEKIGRKIAEV
ncbi:MAG: dTMP kinase [Chitinivibrionales bacterium]|nr:dTMP kinase [Chitinivibrionales bacterium]MBD3355700.1 dTMP kinase [Chitinivibrionales bacterium]